jgi:hypothetical protein
VQRWDLPGDERVELHPVPNAIMAVDSGSAGACGLQQLDPSWRNMSLTLLLVGSSNCAMSNLFPCEELQKLKQQYQAALCIWGQFVFPLQ